MKEKEIHIDYKDHELILYAEKEDKSIGPVRSGSYMTANHLEDFYQIRESMEKRLVASLKKKQISPIGRFRELEEFTITELANRTGIARRRVKKHLEHKYFLKATVEELKRYTEVFNIPVANLFQLIETCQDASWNIGHNRETAKKKELTISQEKTENPLLIITHPEKNKA